MTIFTSVFLALLVTTVLVRLWLGRRHIAHMQSHRQQVPSAFAASISLEAHQKAADYSTAKTRLVMFEGVVQAILLYVLTLGGVLQWLDASWLDLLPDSTLLRGALVIVSAFAISSLVDIPLD